MSINTSYKFALEFFWHHQKMYKLSVLKKVSALLRLRQVFVETDRVRLSCLVQLLTWLRVSAECHYFWNTERWQSLNWYFSTKQLYQSQKHLPKWRQHFVKNCWKVCAKKHKILYGSDHTILFKFHQHVVQILIK